MNIGRSRTAESESKNRLSVFEDQESESMVKSVEVWAAKVANFAEVVIDVWVTAKVNRLPTSTTVRRQYCTVGLNNLFTLTWWIFKLLTSIIKRRKSQGWSNLRNDEDNTIRSGFWATSSEKIAFLFNSLQNTASPQSNTCKTTRSGQTALID